jgi:dUTP pyrophosphatase
MELEVKRLCSQAILPRRATNGSAGYDLHCIDNLTIPPGELICASTGIAVKLPLGTYGRVASRSGVAVKYNVHVGAGVVDPDYTGEIKVVLCNHGKSVVRFNALDRIAQLILEKYAVARVVEVTDIAGTSRGSGGFGSTGFA